MAIFNGLEGMISTGLTVPSSAGVQAESKAGITAWAGSAGAAGAAGSAGAEVAAGAWVGAGVAVWQAVITIDAMMIIDRIERKRVFVMGFLLLSNSLSKIVVVSVVVQGLLKSSFRLGSTSSLIMKGNHQVYFLIWLVGLTSKRTCGLTLPQPVSGYC
jgi:hypothetical protein